MIRRTNITYITTFLLFSFTGHSTSYAMHNDDPLYVPHAKAKKPKLDDFDAALKANKRALSEESDSGYESDSESIYESDHDNNDFFLNAGSNQEDSVSAQSRKRKNHSQPTAAQCTQENLEKYVLHSCQKFRKMPEAERLRQIKYPACGEEKAFSDAAALQSHIRTVHLVTPKKKTANKKKAKTS